MTTLTPKEKLDALSSQVCGKIKEKLRVWCNDRKSYWQNINEFETFFNSLINGKLSLQQNFNNDINFVLSEFDICAKQLNYDHCLLLKEWLNEDEKLATLLSQVCERIKANLSTWHADQPSHWQNINNLESFFNKLIDSKDALVLQTNFRKDVTVLLAEIDRCKKCLTYNHCVSLKEWLTEKGLW
jgi:hypothetical protein